MLIFQTALYGKLVKLTRYSSIKYISVCLYTAMIYTIQVNT